jgi:hypothetical protein
MSSANNGEEELRKNISKNETRAEWGGAAVVFGLIVEVMLTAAYRHGESIIEGWGPVFADVLITLGVAAEILFARKARSTSETLQLRSAEKVAEANARAKEAELKLEQLRKLAGPRQLDRSIFVKELEGKPKANVQIWYVTDSSDAFSFATQLLGALINAGWGLDMPEPLPGPPYNAPFSAQVWNKLPKSVVAGGQASGVTVVGANEDFHKETPFKALYMALSKSTDFGVSGSGSSQAMPVPDGTVRVVVAAKTDPLFTVPAPAGPETVPTK